MHNVDLRIIILNTKFSSVVSSAFRSLCLEALWKSPRFYLGTVAKGKLHGPDGSRNIFAIHFSSGKVKE